MSIKRATALLLALLAFWLAFTFETTTGVSAAPRRVTDPAHFNGPSAPSPKPASSPISVGADWTSGILGATVVVGLGGYGISREVSLNNNVNQVKHQVLQLQRARAQVLQTLTYQLTNGTAMPQPAIDYYNAFMSNWNSFIYSTPQPASNPSGQPSTESSKSAFSYSVAPDRDYHAEQLTIAQGATSLPAPAAIQTETPPPPTPPAAYPIKQSLFTQVQNKDANTYAAWNDETANVLMDEAAQFIKYWADPKKGGISATYSPEHYANEGFANVLASVEAIPYTKTEPANQVADVTGNPQGSSADTQSSDCLSQLQWPLLLSLVIGCFQQGVAAINTGINNLGVDEACETLQFLALSPIDDFKDVASAARDQNWDTVYFQTKTPVPIPLAACHNSPTPTGGM